MDKILWSISTISLFENKIPFICNCGCHKFYVSPEDRFYKCFNCSEIYEGY